MNPSTDWAEIIPADESARFERYAEQLHAMQKRRAEKTKTTSRALHAKGQAGVEAELTVLPDLPSHARVGLFATPATYRALVRFSNGAGVRQGDRKPDVRGVAIKVMGVGGKKIIPGMEDAKTQDFLLIRNAATPFRNADEFVTVLRAAEQPALLLFRVIGALGFGAGLGILRRLVREISAPTGSLATARYFSATPIQWGKYAVHYALTPHTGASSDRESTPADLGAELADRLRSGAVTYDLRVQFYVDAIKTPIEDASVEWLEADAPFVTVARLTLPKQDPGSPRGLRVAEHVERLSFDPWHAPVEFKPLGNMMRARNHAYRVSTKERGAAPEPDGSERFDGA